MIQALEMTQIREGFTTVTPYVRVSEPGLAEFLSTVFGAVETSRTSGPGGGVHREMRVGDSMLMIGEDPTQGVMPIRPAAFHVHVPDVDAAFERAVSAGAESMGAPEDRHYGERAGFVRDRFGNHWYIATWSSNMRPPEGVRTVMPFLHPPEASKYIDFLKAAFGAVEEERHDLPNGLVIHARLRIGNAQIELGEPDPPRPMPSGFYLYVGDADVVYEQAIAAGATSLWAPRDEWYGDRVGAVQDAMGNQWFIAQPA